MSILPEQFLQGFEMGVRFERTRVCEALKLQFIPSAEQIESMTMEEVLSKKPIVDFLDLIMNQPIHTPEQATRIAQEGATAGGAQ